MTPKHGAVSRRPVTNSQHPARGEDLSQLLVEARHVSLVAHLMDRLHRNDCVVGRIQSIGPVRSLEVRMDETRLGNRFNRSRLRLSMYSKKSRSHSSQHSCSGRERTRPRVQDPHPARERTTLPERGDALGEANAHGMSPRLVQVASRDPRVNLLGIEDADARRNVGAWIGIVNGH